jgi:hypothetical protein
MHTGEHCLQAANSSMALNAAVAYGARRGARREEVRRNGEEGKGKGVGLLFAPSQRIRRAAHTWVAIPGPVGRSLARPACSVWRGRSRVRGARHARLLAMALWLQPWASSRPGQFQPKKSSIPINYIPLFQYIPSCKI